MKKTVLGAWSFIFDHEQSPLRHIPDFSTRHMIFQMLGWMWAVAFSIAIGSYTFMAVSLVGHVVLIAAFAITVATYSAASVRPKLFLGVTPKRRK
jgi:hypothetical protein